MFYALSIVILFILNHYFYSEYWLWLAISVVLLKVIMLDRKQAAKSLTLQYPQASQPAIKSTTIDKLEVAKRGYTQRQPAANQVTIANNRITNSIQSIKQTILQFCLTGNVLAKIGAIVLLIGLGFALHYASINDLISLGARFILIAILGVLLIVIGWIMRGRHFAFAVLLQGTGLGIIYLTMFTGYQYYALFGVTFTFMCLILLLITGVLLALLQNSMILACSSIIGGFLAPLVANSGSNNYVGLFSYFLVLNSAVLILAWFRTWRLLNIIGFAATFIIGGYWGYYQYRPDFYVIIQAFFIMFYIMYAILPLWYQQKGKGQLACLTDVSLIFGLPLIGLTFQCALVKDFPYAMGGSALLFAIFYIGLCKASLKMACHKIISEAYVALAIIFLLLVVPLLQTTIWLAGVWALEATCIVWFGFRTKRTISIYLGLLALLAAQLLFFIELTKKYLTFSLFGYSQQVTKVAVVSSGYLTALSIAIAVLVCSYLLENSHTVSLRKQSLQAKLIFAVGAIWLWGAGVIEILHRYPYYQGLLWTSITEFNKALHVIHLILLYFMLVALAAGAVYYFNPWRRLKYILYGLLPMMALFACELLFIDKAPIMWIWLLSFIQGAMILRNSKANKTPTVITYCHIFWLLSVSIIVSKWLFKLVIYYIGYATMWNFVAWAVPVSILMLVINYISQQQCWPLTQLPRLYQHQLPLAAIGYLCLWCFFSNLFCGAYVGPVLYLPLLNPVDLLSIIILAYCYLQYVNHKFDKNIRTLLLKITIALTLFWLNAFILRILQHYQQLPYDSVALWNSSVVQTVLAIYWTFIGLSFAKVASTQQMRKLWILGFAIIIAVIMKLFIVDLHSVQTIWRALSFVGVGGLLLAVGYFAPIPKIEYK